MGGVLILAAVITSTIAWADIKNPFILLYDKKISNIRDLADSPPKNWTLERRVEYVDWATRVVDGLRGTHPKLEARFDEASTERAESGWRLGHFTMGASFADSVPG